MKTIITIATIQDKAVEFGVRIHFNATDETRKDIVDYGVCLIADANIGAVTRARFVIAMNRCWSLEYDEFTNNLFENEIALLKDQIAKVVARLEYPYGMRK